MERFNNYLEGLCYGGGGYRWRCLGPLGGHFLKAHTSVHDGS